MAGWRSHRGWRRNGEISIGNGWRHLQRNESESNLAAKIGENGIIEENGASAANMKWQRIIGGSQLISYQSSTIS
jgi:hypothetical protein